MPDRARITGARPIPAASSNTVRRGFRPAAAPAAKSPTNPKTPYGRSSRAIAFADIRDGNGTAEGLEQPPWNSLLTTSPAMVG